MSVRTARKITQHEALRRHRGLLVTQVADELGVSHGYVSWVEAGRKAASPRYQEAFARLVGVSPDLVFDDEGLVR